MSIRVVSVRAHDASEQAASLDRVNVSPQQLGSETHQNAGRAEAARKLAMQAPQSSERGTAEMERLSKAMLRIRESSATARILKTIDEIAFQTNLLALTAAVESARAGEVGRGFAGRRRPGAHARRTQRTSRQAKLMAVRRIGRVCRAGREYRKG